MNPTMADILIKFLTIVVSFCAGGGGLFAYLQHKNKLNQEDRMSTTTEWKELYDEMKDRLDKQEEENEKLVKEIFNLKEQVHALTLELTNYKTFDKYINDLEKYIDPILDGHKSLVNEEAYKNICSKRPIKTTSKKLD